MYLHHYFNKKNGPFLSVSDLPEKEARKTFYNMVKYLTEKSGGVYNPDDITDEFVVNRHKFRRDLEDVMRQIFINKNGNVSRKYPYYLILSKDNTYNKGLFEFYENADIIKISVEKFDMSTVSFTYGDSFVQYYHNENTDKPELIYTYDEILKVVKEHGWVIKNENGWGFIEAHLWSDEQISEYREQYT